MCRKWSLSLFSLAAMLALCLCAPGAFAYNYAKSITIDRSKISSCATLSNYPLLFSVTDANLKVTGSGGRVTDANGDDIIFRGLDATTCGGPSSCTLDHEIEKYVSTTGELVAWVRLPSVNGSTAGSNTVIYVNYGDSTVTTPTTNPTGVWDSNYKGVWHLKEGTGVTAADSTSNANSAVPNNGNPTTATGQIGGALTFSGQRLNIAASASLDLTSATSPNWTMSAWVKPTSYTGTSWPAIYSYGSWRASLGLSQVEAGTDGRIENWTNDTTALHSTSAVTLNAWNHVTITRSAATTTFYWNGSANGSFTTPAAVTTANQVSGIGSDGNGAYDATEHFIGLIDEVRVSKSVRSACWIQGEYNNQSSPSTFYTVGSETQFLATISSAANQSFAVGQASTTASVITVTDAASNTITTANEIRIRIPATFNMTWDTSVTTITRGGGASAKVSATLKAYEDSNRTAVVDVTTNFAANDVLTITGLKFTSFTAISAADNLQLVVGGAGAATTNLDDKTITIVAAVGGFNAYETSTAAGAITGVIKTKIAGSTVSLDVIALNAAKTAIGTTFTGTVRVEVLDASNNSAGLDANGCRSSWTVIQTLADPAFVSGDLGRKTVSFTQANSYPEARLKIYYPVSSPTAIGCSGDNFAIRPNTLASFAVTDTDWQTTGAPGARALNLLTFAAITPIHKAGRPFSVRATALNAAGTPAVTTNYTGAPTATFTACAGAACTSSFGTLTLATTFIAGLLASDVASYNNVGAFSVQLQDTTFASVDAADTTGDCTGSGRYVCSASLDVGRFVPDHFAVALNAPVFGPACGPFTYIGQKFNYTTAPVITMTAQGFANNTTTLYNTIGSWFRITSASLTGKAYTWAIGTLDASGLPGTDPVIASSGAGVGTLTFGSGTGLLFTRTTPTAPASPYDADISLAINVIDADGAAYATNPARFGAATAGNGIAFSDGNALTTNDKQMRFGRLFVPNSYGTEKLNLTVPLEVQYWTAGSIWARNTLDNCTSINLANSAQLANKTGALSGSAFGPPAVYFGIPATTTATVVQGLLTLTLAKPNPIATGYVDLGLNLGSAAGSAQVSCPPSWVAPSPASVSGLGLAYLRGQWCSPNYDQDPSARITLGVTQNKFIFNRENY